MYHGRLDYYTSLGLRELKKRINDAGIPSSKLDETINLATWNIREFGKKRRRKASIHFIAEILGQFDLIAVTELRDNLTELKKVLEILGPYWDVVFSDYAMDRGGNKERIAFIFDKRAVVFTGLAAEADPPRKKDRRTNEYVPSITWWRPPFMASFSAGNFDFVLLAVHIRWGKKLSERKGALAELSKWVEKKRKDRHGVDKDIIVVGDFNIPDLDDDLFNAMTKHKLKIPDSLRNQKFGSNLAKDKRYDQIFYYPSHTKSFTNHGGVLDFYQKNIDKLYPEKTPTKREFTYELSDHLPLWVQLDVDVSDERLEQIIERHELRRAKRANET
ncbi:endonuclease/exonuclease/phosphatase family protein [bacterium SCSIO 12741]|nr:endonuclease/exonuclease/phosphatase family protein [bacterium SCSIO 12741]